MTPVTAASRVKPWHRALAVVIAAASIAIAVWALHDIGTTPAKWSKHIGGALLSIFVGGLAWPVFAPKPTMWFFALAGWTLPAAFGWIGVEHFLDWYEFYKPTGRNRVATPTGAAIQGSFAIVLGVALLAFYLFAVRSAVLRRRDPSRPTMAEAIRRRSKRT